MPRRELSETGLYHIATRSAGQIALFEDDDDRRFYLRLLKRARDEVGARILAWVLMTDHVHIVADFGEKPEAVSAFMHMIDARYTRYFNAKTGRYGTLFQGNFWSKPIAGDSQLIATVHYVHMNPEAAGMAPMRQYRWSSYQEYAVMPWITDTGLVLDVFGGFERFDAYGGSSKDVVCREYRGRGTDNRDEVALHLALQLADVRTTAELRSLPVRHRNDVIRALCSSGVSVRRTARVMGLGASTVAGIAKPNTTPRE